MTPTLLAMADIIDKKKMRRGYIKDGRMPRLTRGLKKAYAGGRKRVRDDVCFICKQPSHWKSIFQSDKK
jgi:hypothetical protein